MNVIRLKLDFVTYTGQNDLLGVRHSYWLMLTISEWTNISQLINMADISSFHYIWYHCCMVLSQSCNNFIKVNKDFFFFFGSVEQCSVKQCKTSAAFNDVENTYFIHS